MSAVRFSCLSKARVPGCFLPNCASMSSCSDDRRRVVVTGMGLVTCLGVGVEHVWQRLLVGDCGITSLTDKEYDDIPSKVAGRVPRGNDHSSLNLDRCFSAADQKSMSPASLYALVAAEEALEMAKWKPRSEVDRCRSGVAVGTGMVSLDDIVHTGAILKEKGYKRVSPHFVPKILANMASGLISLKYGLKGVNHSVSTACTTGLHAIGDASRFIKHGDADVMVCGGTEACVYPVAVAGFARMRALSTDFNNQPSESSRPFDKDRNGFVISEGAGILVLEELQHARQRKANIYAEILGYGLSGDASHITAPSSDGDGAYRCMAAALRDAKLSPDVVGHINAHATATPLGDAAEVQALERLFPMSKKTLGISSTKGAVGHLLGAAGSVEAIFTVLACHTGKMPWTLNLQTPDVGFGLNLLRKDSSIEWPLSDDKLQRIALTNSFGFGGTNASLCVGDFRVT